ncbi:hypothetical protein HK098_003573 [Nowakowskiella sp. JEL0407]|nr:hypothetical protein HK098_003573 [Nowakowskiella sp. JEL0407]
MTSQKKFTANIQFYKPSTDFIFDAGHLSKQVYSPNQTISAKLTVINNFEQYDMSDFLVIVRGYAQAYDSQETGRRSDFANYTPLPLAGMVNDRSVDSTAAGSVELFCPVAVKVIPLDKQNAEFHIQIPNKYLPSHVQNKHGCIQYELLAINEKKRLITEPRKIKFEGSAPLDPPSDSTIETLKKSAKTEFFAVEASVELKDTHLSFYSSASAPSDIRKIPYKLSFTTTNHGKSMSMKIETKVLYKGRFRGHKDYPKVVYNSTNDVEVSSFEPITLSLSIDVYPSTMAISGPITIPSRQYIFDDATFLPKYDKKCIGPIFTNSYELEITISKVSSGLKAFLGLSNEDDYIVVEDEDKNENDDIERGKNKRSVDRKELRMQRGSKNLQPIEFGLKMERETFRAEGDEDGAYGDDLVFGTPNSKLSEGLDLEKVKILISPTWTISERLTQKAIISKIFHYDNPRTELTFNYDLLLQYTPSTTLVRKFSPEED